MINSTFSIFDINVYALIDPRSADLFICTTLVLNKKLLVELTEFVIKVANPLGQCC